MAVQNQIAVIGIALVFLGMLLIIASSFLQKNSKVEGAGIVMIGPIPIFFGSDRLLVPLAILAILLIILWFIFFSM